MTNLTAELVLERERTTHSAADEEQRWPPAHSALLIVGASVCLWAIILAGVGWLVG